MRLVKIILVPCLPRPVTIISTIILAKSTLHFCDYNSLTQFLRYLGQLVIELPFLWLLLKKCVSLLEHKHFHWSIYITFTVLYCSANNQVPVCLTLWCSCLDPDACIVVLLSILYSGLNVCSSRWLTVFLKFLVLILPINKECTHILFKNSIFWLPYKKKGTT